DRDRQDRDLVYLHERWRERLRHRRPERLSERGYSEKHEQRESFHRPSESSVNPIILYSRRAPTFASHSVAPGATSQRSRPTMRFFARRIARSSPIASFLASLPGTGVPVPGQSVGSRLSLSYAK